MVHCGGMQIMLEQVIVAFLCWAMIAMTAGGVFVVAMFVWAIWSIRE